MLRRNRDKHKKSKLKGVLSKLRRPTRENRAVASRILIVLLLLVFSVICCVFVNDAIGYLPLIIVLVGVLFSFAYVRIVGNSFEIDDTFVPRDCARGDSIDFDLVFVNKTPLPIAKIRASFALSNVFGQEESAMESDLALAPRERLEYGFAVDFNHIGEYQVRLNWVRLFDPFGLFWRTFAYGRNYVVSVTPQTYHVSTLDEFAVNEAASEKMVKPIVTDDLDYAGVRDYVPGDPLKAIHWKLSARSDHYFTRLFEAFGVPGVSVFLDFHSPAYESEEMMSAFDSIVEAGYSMWRYAREMGMDTELAFCGKDMEEVRRSAISSADVVGLIKRMPNLSPDIPQRNLVDMVRRIAGARQSNDNIIISTSNVEQELVQLLLELRNRKKHPLLIVSIPEGVDREIRKKIMANLKRFHGVAVPVFVIDRASELGYQG